MGYILPIQQFEYKEYQKRVTKEKQDPYYIEKPYKALLEIQYQESEREYATAKFTSKKQHIPNRVNDEQGEEVFKELTGKGVLFNKSI